MHATNLDGIFLGCKHGIAAMRRTGCGSIINVGSRSGVVGIPAASACASSKGAIRNHTKSVALYCAEQGLAVRYNVIQPAAILTPMWEPQVPKARVRDAIVCAAAEEFAAYGYQGATLSRIASQAGTSIGNLYKYFANILDAEGNERALREALTHLTTYHSAGKAEVHSRTGRSANLDFVASYRASAVRHGSYLCARMPQSHKGRGQ